MPKGYTETEKQKGRKRLPPDQARSAVIRFRLTVSERERLLARAESAGVPLTDFARALLLDETRQPSKGLDVLRTPKTPPSHAYMVELIRLGNNLNQIARAVNQGSDTPKDWDALQNLISAIDAKLRENGA